MPRRLWRPSLSLALRLLVTDSSTIITFLPAAFRPAAQLAPFAHPSFEFRFAPLFLPGLNAATPHETSCAASVFGWFSFHGRYINLTLRYVSTQKSVKASAHCTPNSQQS